MGNVSKRESRLEHRDEFVRAVTDFRSAHYESAKAVEPPAPGSDSWGKVTVSVRKRPIFDVELGKGEYDVVSVLHPRVVVHDCRMTPDLKGMFVNHTSFPFDYGFSEDTSNDSVYRCVAKPLVAWAIAGGMSTVFMYGQTGSGKTHTMSAIQQRAATDVFRGMATAAASGVAMRAAVQFFEIAGKGLYDLTNDRVPLSLMEGADGRVHVRGGDEQKVSNSEELLKLVEAGNAMRSSKATGKNDNSSRSHSVLRIVLRPADSRETSGPGALGMLTLVDLAGSERGEDSKHHDAERMREAAEINSSLMALKDCIRARAAAEAKGEKDVRVPFRSSKLTQVLKDAFVNRRSRTAVIATVSPIPSDTEHTVNTLKHASMMKSGASDITETKVTVKDEAQWMAEQAPLPTVPAKWTHDEVVNWVNTVSGGSYAQFASKVQSSLAGKQFTRLPKARFTMMCGGDAAAGEALFGLLREEIARVNEEHAARRNAQRHARDKRRGVTAAAAAGSDGGRGGRKAAGGAGPRRNSAAAARDKTAAAAAAAHPPAERPRPARRPRPSMGRDGAGTSPDLGDEKPGRRPSGSRPSTTGGRVNTSGSMGLGAMGGSPDSLDKGTAVPNKAVIHARERAKEMELADRLAREGEPRRNSPPGGVHKQPPTSLPHMEPRGVQSAPRQSKQLGRAQSMPNKASKRENREDNLGALGQQLLRDPPASPDHASAARKDAFAPPPTPEHGSPAREAFSPGGEKKSIDELRVRLRASEAARRRAVDECDFAKAENEELKGTLSDTQEVMDRMTSERDQLRREIDSLQDQVELLQAERDSFAKRAGGGDREELAKSLSSVRSAASELGGSQGAALVKDWLSKLRLGIYSEQLTDLGVDSLAALTEVEEADLDSIGMKKLHKKRFLRAVADALGSTLEATVVAI